MQSSLQLSLLSVLFLECVSLSVTGKVFEACQSQHFKYVCVYLSLSVFVSEKPVCGYAFTGAVFEQPPLNV